VGNNADVAIIVSDVKKADADGTIEHFEQYFKDNNVSGVNAVCTGLLSTRRMFN
jgi:hypothetical protein